MEITHLTSDNFEKEVLESNIPVLVDFWATWCGPCQMLGPIIDEVAQENENIKVCKINVDQQPELVVKYGVMTIPTLLLFEKGEVVRKESGYMPKSEVLALLK